MSRELNLFKLIGFGFLAILILSIGMCSTETVNTGHRGVVVKFGKPTDTLGEGFHMVNPFTTDIVEMNVRQQKWQGKTVAYTQDVQQADIEFTVTYSLQPTKALATYRDVGEEWAETLMPQVVYQNIKDIFGRSEAVEDTINNRETVQTVIRDRIMRGLAARGITVHGFELTDISFSNNFENAVEQKQVAVELANAAKNKTVEIEERAKQRVIAAKADAEAMEVKNRALAGSPKLVEYEAVQKWDGKLPQNMYGGAVPFISVK